jgi:lipopolysaccharide export system ATP-binding protein
MYGFEDVSFASLGNSEIEHIFSEVVDKNANNSFVFQKKKSIHNILWSRHRQNLKVSQPELHYLTTYIYEG